MDSFLSEDLGANEDEGIQNALDVRG